MCLVFVVCAVCERLKSQCVHCLLVLQVHCCGAAVPDNTARCW